MYGSFYCELIHAGAGGAGFFNVKVRSWKSLQGIVAHEKRIEQSVSVIFNTSATVVF
jgi:hypothetical protein